MRYYPAGQTGCRMAWQRAWSGMPIPFRMGSNTWACGEISRRDRNPARWNAGSAHMNCFPASQGGEIFAGMQSIGCFPVGMRTGGGILGHGRVSRKCCRFLRAGVKKIPAGSIGPRGYSYYFLVYLEKLNLWQVVG